MDARRNAPKAANQPSRGPGDLNTTTRRELAPRAFLATVATPHGCAPLRCRFAARLTRRDATPRNDAAAPAGGRRYRHRTDIAHRGEEEREEGGKETGGEKDGRTRQPAGGKLAARDEGEGRRWGRLEGVGMGLWAALGGKASCSCSDCGVLVRFRARGRAQVLKSSTGSSGRHR